MQDVLINGESFSYSSSSVAIDGKEWVLSFELGAGNQLLCRSALRTVTDEKPLFAMVEQLEVAPTAVMFGDQVYVFYLTDQVLYSVYDQASGWIPGGAVPGTNGVECFVSAAVFTPPGAAAQQLFLFYVETLGDFPGVNTFYGEDEIYNYFNIVCVTTIDGSTWTQVGTIGSTKIDGETGYVMSSPAVVAYAPSSSEATQLYVFYTVGVLDASGNPTTFYTCYSTYTGEGEFGSAEVAVSGQTFPAETEPTPTSVVATPSGATSPLIYLFYNNLYTTVEGQISTLFCTTFDGSTWVEGVACSQCPEGYISAAVFPSQSFQNMMSSSQDIYFGYSINSIKYVTPLSVIQTYGGTASQFETSQQPCMANGTLLPVQFPAMAYPQVWSFGVTGSQLFYDVFGYPRHADFESLHSLDELNSATVNSIATTDSLDYNQLSFQLSEFQAALFQNGWSRKFLSTMHPASSPSAVRFQERAYLFTNSTANQICYVVYDGRVAESLTAIQTGIGGEAASLSSMTAIPMTSVSGSPSAVVFNGLLYVFYQGADANAGELWYMTSTNGVTWAPSQQVVGVTLSESPSAVVFNGALYVFYQGANDTGQLWYSNMTGGNWQAPIQVIPVGQTASEILLTGSPSATVAFDTSANAKQLMVIYTQSNTTSPGQVANCTLTDGLWTQTELTGVTTSASPSAAFVGETLSVLYAAAGGDAGQLWYTQFNGQDWSVPARLGNTTTMSGTATCIACAFPGVPVPSYCIFHNNSGDITGQITYCQVTYETQAISPVGGTNAITSTPSVAVFNNSVWVFYLGPEGEQICYVTAPIASLDPSTGLLTFGDSMVLASSTSKPAAIVFPIEVSATASDSAQLYVFYMGPQNPNEQSYNLLYSVTVDGSSWTPNTVTYETGGAVYPAQLPYFPISGIRDGTLYVSGHPWG